MEVQGRPVRQPHPGGKAQSDGLDRRPAVGRHGLISDSFHVSTACDSVSAALQLGKDGSSPHQSFRTAGARGGDVASPTDGSRTLQRRMAGRGGRCCHFCHPAPAGAETAGLSGAPSDPSGRPRGRHRIGTREWFTSSVDWT